MNGETMQHSSMRATWFPASFWTPEDEAHHQVRVTVTDVGLVVHSAPNVVVFEASADWTNVPKPDTRFPQGQYGFWLPTDVGVVKVALTGGCGCGHPLKLWQPEYAQRVLSWA